MKKEHFLYLYLLKGPVCIWTGHSWRSSKSLFSYVSYLLLHKEDLSISFKPKPTDAEVHKMPITRFYCSGPQPRNAPEGSKSCQRNPAQHLPKRYLCNSCFSHEGGKTLAVQDTLSESWFQEGRLVLRPKSSRSWCFWWWRRCLWYTSFEWAHPGSHRWARKVHTPNPAPLTIPAVTSLNPALHRSVSLETHLSEKAKTKLLMFLCSRFWHQEGTDKVEFYRQLFVCVKSSGIFGTFQTGSRSVAQ